MSDERASRARGLCEENCAKFCACRGDHYVCSHHRVLRALEAEEDRQLRRLVGEVVGPTQLPAEVRAVMDEVLRAEEAELDDLLQWAASWRCWFLPGVCYAVQRLVAEVRRLRGGR